MFSYSIRQLVLPLPALFFSSCHRWRHPPDRRIGDNELVVSLVERSRRIQTVIISISVQDQRIDGGPLDLFERCQ
jgi:hypothetical protein